MTRIYSVTYREHLHFQPEAMDAGTQETPNAKLEQPPVDTWRTVSRIVAVEGYAPAAIDKTLRLAAGDEDAKEDRVSEVQIISIVLQGEAE